MYEPYTLDLFSHSNLQAKKCQLVKTSSNYLVTIINFILLGDCHIMALIHSEKSNFIQSQLQISDDMFKCTLYGLIRFKK